MSESSEEQPVIPNYNKVQHNDNSSALDEDDFVHIANEEITGNGADYNEVERSQSPFKEDSTKSEEKDEALGEPKVNGVHHDSEEDSSDEDDKMDDVLAEYDSTKTPDTLHQNVQQEIQPQDQQNEDMQHEPPTHEDLPPTPTNEINEPPETLSEVDSNDDFVHVSEPTDIDTHTNNIRLTTPPHPPRAEKGRDIGAIIASRTNNAPRLAQPKKPMRKGVKPPTRGEPAAFKLGTKTETAPPPTPSSPPSSPSADRDAIKSLPPLPHPPSHGPLPPPPSAEEDRPLPRSPIISGRPGMPNFAAEALNVQLKKAPVRPKTEAGYTVNDGHPPAPPPVPPARPPRPPRPSRSQSDTSPNLPSVPDHKEEEGKQGFLHKRGGFFKSWKKRWFVLKDGKVYYYRTQKADTLKGVIVDIYKVEKLLKDSKDYCFCISTPRRNYHCAAESTAELEAWVEKISAIIKK